MLHDWYILHVILYLMSPKDLTQLYGGYLLGLKTSYFDVLNEAYPEYEWLPWKFNTFSSKTLIINSNKRQKYMEWIANQFNIKEMNDWYKIKAEVNSIA